MKKVLKFAVVISLFLAIALIPSVAFAAEKDGCIYWDLSYSSGYIPYKGEIPLGKTEVTAYEEYILHCYKFIPEKTGYYVFREPKNESSLVRVVNIIRTVFFIGRFSPFLR